MPRRHHMEHVLERLAIPRRAQTSIPARLPTVFTHVTNYGGAPSSMPVDRLASRPVTRENYQYFESCIVVTCRTRKTLTLNFFGDSETL